MVDFTPVLWNGVWMWWWLAWLTALTHSMWGGQNQSNEVRQTLRSRGTVEEETHGVKGSTRHRKGYLRRILHEGQQDVTTERKENEPKTQPKGRKTPEKEVRKPRSWSKRRKSTSERNERPRTPITPPMSNVPHSPNQASTPNMASTPPEPSATQSDYEDYAKRLSVVEIKQPPSDANPQNPQHTPPPAANRLKKYGQRRCSTEDDVADRPTVFECVNAVQKPAISKNRRRTKPRCVVKEPQIDYDKEITAIESSSSSEEVPECVEYDLASMPGLPYLQNFMTVEEKRVKKKKKPKSKNKVEKPREVEAPPPPLPQEEQQQAQTPNQFSDNEKMAPKSDYM